MLGRDEQKTHEVVRSLQLVELHRPSGLRVCFPVLAVKVRDRPRDLARRPVAPDDVHAHRRQDLLPRAAPVVEAAVVQRPPDVVPEDPAQERRPDDVLGALQDRRVRQAAQGRRVHLERGWLQSRVDGPGNFVQRQTGRIRWPLWDHIGEREGGIEGRDLGTEQDDLVIGGKRPIGVDVAERRWGGGSGSSAAGIWGCMRWSAPSASSPKRRTISYRRV